MNQTTNQGYNLVENTDEIHTSLSAWNANFNKIDADVTKLQTNIKVLEDNFDIDTTPNSNNFLLEDSASGYIPRDDEGNPFDIKIGDGPEITQKTTEGKNLFDKDDTTIISNAYINTTNSTVNSNNNARMLHIPCKPNTTYTISRVAGKRFVVISSTDYANGAVGNVIVYDNNATSLTITTGENDTYLCVFYYISTADTLSEETIRNSIMINEGSASLPYETYTGGQASPNPDYPQDIVVIEGNANIIANNKNLLHLKDYSATTNPSRRSLTSTASNIGNNSITITSTGTYSHTELVFDDLLIKNEDAVITGIFDETISGRTSKVGFSIAGSDDKENYTTIQTNYVDITAGTSQKISQTFNIGSYKYIRIRIYANNTGTSASGLSSVNVSNLMLSYGTDDTFIPYKGQTYPITLPTGMFLGSVSTASNYIYGTKDNWKLHSGVGKAILDGSETWNTVGWASPKYAGRTQISGIKQTTSANDNSNCLSNYFKPYTQNALYGLTSPNYGVSNRAEHDEIIIRNDGVVDTAGLKTWLSTHNIIVYYILATSTDTAITDQTLISQLNDIADNLQTYKGGTIVFTTSENLEPNIQFDYLVNPLASIEARLDLLED